MEYIIGSVQRGNASRLILKTKDKINQILSERTGQPLEKIQVDCERDYFMSAEEAKNYGLVDAIL